MSDYLTVQEVAELARCEHKSVRRAIAGGQLAAVGRGVRNDPLLISPDVARAWIEGTPARSRPLSTTWRRSAPYDEWPPDERAYALVLLGDPCAYCDAAAEAIDHIDPQVAGGDHLWSNFTGACQRCNSSKNARPLLTFLLRRAPA